MSIKKHEIRTILLTDDKDNQTKAKDDGIISCSIEEYVKSLTDHQTLQDKLSQKNYDLDSNKVVLFPPHLSSMTIHDGIKSGKLLQGTFLASRDNYLEGSVNVESFEKFVSYITHSDARYIYVIELLLGSSARSRRIKSSC